MKNNFNAFLGNSFEEREYLRKPMNVNNHAIYSNGHILMRDEQEIPTGAEIAKPPETIFKLVDWFSEKYSNISYRIDDLDYESFKCKSCKGTGGQEICYECGGNESIFLEGDYNDYWVDCRSCETGENKYCFSCGGLGFGGKNTEKGDLFFNLNNIISVNPGYLKLIVDNLINPRIFLPTNKKENEKIKIVFDGGEGFLMPVRKSLEEKHIQLEEWTQES